MKRSAIMSTDRGPRSERFLLERFTWSSPDRLELAGRFVDLGSRPSGAPVLVLHGEERVHRLPAVPGDSSGAPDDGEPWHAAFAWAEPPEAFSTAELELGAVAVELPEPAEESAGDPQPLPVRRAEPVEGASRLALEAELLAAREQVRELREAAEREREELERARAALEAERARRATDGERFLAGIAQVRAAAEETVAATAAECDVLREQVEGLEAQARDADAALANLGTMRKSAEAAAADAEHLLGRMQELKHALAEPD
jgi:hypothetical protein